MSSHVISGKASAAFFTQGFSFYGVLVLISLSSAVFVYLGSINESTIRGSRVHEVEQKIATLERSRDELRIAEAELRKKVQEDESLVSIGMTPVKARDYITVEVVDTVAVEYSGTADESISLDL